jgi:pimeloyl-ACP methyl ester carboxylesterase
MIKNNLHTPSGARLQLVKSIEKKNLQWLFLPGGPGLGSESLNPLINVLQLPGTMWCLDLPGDGSNTTQNNYESFSHWSEALVEAVRHFEHVILVAHSTGGMYALSIPELEGLLDGLILLDSAPNASWQDSFMNLLKDFPIPEIPLLQERYIKNPNNEILREITIASAPYLFTEQGMEKGIKMLQFLPYNYETHLWSDQHFDNTYQARWIPKTIPTLILSGEHDLITPLKLFKELKEFHRDNIKIKSIKNAGHFPWIENPADVAAEFKEFSSQF